MKPEKDVLVVLVHSEEIGSETNPGLLSEGRRIADMLGGALSALSFRCSIEDCRAAEDYGASILFQPQGKRALPALCEQLCLFLTRFLKEHSRPRLVLFAHTYRGRRLAPSVAERLDGTAITDCVEIGLCGKALSFWKPVYGDQFEQEHLVDDRILAIATMRPDALVKRTPRMRHPLKVVELPTDVPSGRMQTEILERIGPDPETTDIEHARRIVGTGMGAAQDQNLLPMVEELARLLEGAVGATRPVVEEGHLPRERMIGQSGKEVSPELYLALGISGSPHHVSGIQDSKKVVSINRDPFAPINRFSDVGFVGDLGKILPRLIELIHRWIEDGSHETV